MQAAEAIVPRTAARIRRIDLRVGVGIFLMALSLIGSTALIRKAEARLSVLVAARTVEPGSVIQASDLRVESISLTGGVAYLGEERRSAVIGKIAAEQLWPGKLLSSSSVADTAKLPAGYVAMSLALKPDRAAGGQLRPRDHVAVIASTSPDRPSASTRLLLTDVPVLSIRQGDAADGGAVIVTLRLRLEEARDLAEARSGGEIDLVLLSAAKS